MDFDKYIHTQFSLSRELDGVMRICAESVRATLCVLAVCSEACP